MRRNNQSFPERGTFLYKWKVSPFLIILIVNTMILHISISAARMTWNFPLIRTWFIPSFYRRWETWVCPYSWYVLNDPWRIVAITSDPDITHLLCIYIKYLNTLLIYIEYWSFGCSSSKIWVLVEVPCHCLVKHYCLTDQ